MVADEGESAIDRHGALGVGGDEEQHDRLVAFAVVHGEFEFDLPHDGSPVEGVFFLGKQGVLHLVSHGGTAPVHDVTENLNQSVAVGFPLCGGGDLGAVNGGQHIGQGVKGNFRFVVIDLPGEFLHIHFYFLLIFRKVFQKFKPSTKVWSLASMPTPIAR